MGPPGAPRPARHPHATHSAPETLHPPPPLDASGPRVPLRHPACRPTPADVSQHTPHSPADQQQYAADHYTRRQAAALLRLHLDWMPSHHPQQPTQQARHSLPQAGQQAGSTRQPRGSSSCRIPPGSGCSILVAALLLSLLGWRARRRRRAERALEQLGRRLALFLELLLQTLHLLVYALVGRLPASQEGRQVWRAGGVVFFGGGGRGGT